MRSRTNASIRLGWAWLLLSLLQGRGQRMDVPMPAVPRVPHPTILLTLGRIRKQEASQDVLMEPSQHRGHWLCMVAWHSVPGDCRAQLPDPCSFPKGPDMSRRNSPANPSPATSALVLLWGDTKQNCKIGGVLLLLHVGLARRALPYLCCCFLTSEIPANLIPTKFNGGKKGRYC